MGDFDIPDDKNGAWDYYQIYYLEDDDDDDDDDFFTTENHQNKKYKYTNMSGEGDLPFDPTTTEGEGAGAAGGAVGGDSRGDITLPPPPQPPPDIDGTNPFEPTGGTSTPYPPPGDDNEEIELTNLALEQGDWSF